MKLRLCLLTLTLPVLASAQNILLNPSFESGTLGAIPSVGSITNWAYVDVGNTASIHLVDINAPYGIAASDGVRSVNFGGGGDAANAIVQSFTAEVGATYRLSWDAFTTGSHNAVSGAVLVQTTDTYFTIASTSFAFAPTSGSYQGYTFDFTATQSNLRIMFRDTTGAGLGAGTDWVLDNTSLVQTASAVPEPSTYAALAGLAALGFVAWRRRHG